MDAQPESIRLAMDEAWRDHHHARDQTWKAIQMESVLAAGLITIDFQYRSPIATSAAAALVVLAALFGILISLHHRQVEIRKFTHILNCEEALGLHRADLICDVSLPRALRLRDVFLLSARSTAVFILRLHVALCLFAILVTAARWQYELAGRGI